MTPPVVVHDLADSATRRLLMEHVGNIAITAMCAALGAGCQVVYFEGGVDALNYMKPRSWRQFRVEFDKWHELPNMLQTLVTDVLEQGVRNFIRTHTALSDSLSFERDGVVILVAIDMRALQLTIDYCGW